MAYTSFGSGAGSGPKAYAGGSANFDERTGQYRGTPPPMAQQRMMQQKPIGTRFGAGPGTGPRSTNPGFRSPQPFTNLGPPQGGGDQMMGFLQALGQRQPMQQMPMRQPMQGNPQQMMAMQRLMQMLQGGQIPYTNLGPGMGLGQNPYTNLGPGMGGGQRGTFY